jgi:hypothetical protein
VKLLNNSILSVVVLFMALGMAQSASNTSNKPAQPLPKVPKTVDQAVLILKTKWLSPKDLDWVLRNPQKEVVFRLYRPFGTGVRNEFGLWGSNQELRDSCGKNNPEDCSVVIFNRLWESVRADADPSLVRQLGCQFQLAEAIRIDEKGFYKLTTGELLKAMQGQIDEQLAKLAAAGTPMCQSSLTLEVVGKPDMHCFVDAPFAKNLADGAKETTLETALEGLGFLNLCTPSHVPPKVTLDFARKCQFPTPPYLYGSHRK